MNDARWNRPNTLNIERLEPNIITNLMALLGIFHLAENGRGKTILRDVWDSESFWQRVFYDADLPYNPSIKRERPWVSQLHLAKVSTRFPWNMDVHQFAQ